MPVAALPRGRLCGVNAALRGQCADALARRARRIHSVAMSKVEILAELPRLGLADRREIFDRICEIEERDLLAGVQPDADEKALLDRELAEYRQNPEAGASWQEVETRLRQSARP